MDEPTIAPIINDEVEEAPKRPRLDSVFLPLLFGLVVLIVVCTGITLLIVTGSDKTVDKLDVSSEISTCRSQFANEREGARANLEVAIGNLIVVSSKDQDTDAAVERIRITSEELIEVIDDYDRVLDLPQKEFLAECERRFA